MKHCNLLFENGITIDLFITQTFKERNRGLFAFKGLDSEQALLITPCRSIHTFTMKYALDLVYFDSSFRVVKLVKNIKPNRMSCSLNASSTLELLSGGIEHFGIVPGMMAEVKPLNND